MSPRRLALRRSWSRRTAMLARSNGSVRRPVGAATSAIKAPWGSPSACSSFQTFGELGQGVSHVVFWALSLRVWRSGNAPTLDWLADVGGIRTECRADASHARDA